MTEDRISVGIIGLGRSGWNIHAAGIAQLDRYRVAAVADPMAERRAEAEAKFGCAAYTTPEELINDGTVDLVVVATPSHTHVPLALEALSAGKHVLVEKPLAQSADEVDLMITAAEKADRVLTCFHNRRFDPELLAIQDVIASGRLGDLVLIRRALHRFARRADWQTLRRLGGGELPNTASHLLDQVLLFMDDGPVELFADLRRTVSAGDAEDHVKLCLKTPTGPAVDLESSSVVATPQPDWLIAGTTGGLTSQANKLTVRWFDPAGLTELETDERVAVAGRQYGTGEQIDWHEETIDLEPPSGERTVLYYRRLAETLQDGADVFVTPQSVRRQIALMEQARQQTGFY
ncbi:Gfo/Idh/MocA family oxidoreductase [Phytoactinopolyspora alkaliphila]|uniref:Gfo/Idh/MocA family oxidoreductase n=1 Tax=Phytoactinopolyspora alkaliphila TaxID=1783498 RepID=A0A6N9YLC7_9ACTN|nr:Gfo/Idh/MocA family oxidoreductase [Phytoactinopolyspora alkaliphila]NED95717.1 Gfo/Idh/MocA family oxidoreductase [Phytoactinopolyspora alkaliphila]